MKSNRQSVASPGLEDPGTLFAGERDAFAEGVHGIRESLGNSSRDHLIADEAQISAAIGLELGRQCVGSEQSGAHRYRMLVCETSCHA